MRYLRGVTWAVRLGIFHLFFSLVSPCLLAQEMLLMSLKRLEAEATEICEEIGGGCRLLAHRAFRFGSGVSYVELEESIHNSVVVVHMPAVITADDLMELLIKVRIGRFKADNPVIVLGEVPIGRVKVLDSVGAEIELPLEGFLRTAGAHDYTVRGQQDRVTAIRFPQRVANDVVEGRDFIDSLFHPSLAQEVHELSGIPHLGPETDVRGAEVYLISPSPPPLNDSLFKNLSRIWDLSRRGASVHYLPAHLPYSRSDKADSERGIVIGRLVADLIYATSARSVTFVRLHSAQMEGFFRISNHHIDGRQVMVRALRERGVDALLAPDNGAFRETELIAQGMRQEDPSDTMNTPVAVAAKTRDPMTNQTAVHGISLPRHPEYGTEISIRNMRVGQVDDESESGGTLAKGAELARSAEYGVASVVAAVYHATGSMEAAIASPAIDEVLVTNTLPLRSELEGKVTVISVAGDIAGVIGNIRGRISHLYDECLKQLNPRE